jgi:ubiquinone/menaquinone biosynthesis C-methylase UbiE
MPRLKHAHELLDGPLNDPATLRDNLRDMGRVNRWSGGVDLSRRAIAAVAPAPRAASILDVGTGGADIPVALLDDARRRGRGLTVTAVDARPEVLAAARAANPALDAVPGLTLEVADGRALPYPDGAFDVAHASLVLHHLEPDEAAAFLGELARVARQGVVINDLSRTRLTHLGAWILSRACTGNHYTRHDAPLSARRAYTADEAVPMLLRAGLRPVLLAHGLVGHRWVVAAVHR